MDVVRFFDASHSALHAGDVYDGRTPTVDRWLGGLTEAQLRVRPPGLNSIIWLLWHMARTEDAAVRGEQACTAAGRNLSREEWSEHLGAEPYRRTCPQFPAGS